MTAAVAAVAQLRSIFFPFLGAAIIIGLAFFAFNVWMLIDAIQRPVEHFNPPESRTWWIVGLAVGLILNTLGFVASIVYFFVVRKPAVEGRVAAPLLCPACGTRQSRDARFCKACGIPITGGSTT